MRIETDRNHADYQEWLYLGEDGDLRPDQRRELERHLAACGECRREKRALRRLDAMLTEAVVPVDDDFAREVMERLPDTAWETRSVAGWRVAVAVFLLLGVAAGFLSVGGERLASEVPLAGAAVALFGLFQSALIAGAGLLAASWTGLGMALDRIFEGSRMAFAMFGLFVLGVDVLFIRLILRYRTSEAVGKEPPRRGSEN